MLDGLIRPAFLYVLSWFANHAGRDEQNRTNTGGMPGTDNGSGNASKEKQGVVPAFPPSFGAKSFSFGSDRRTAPGQKGDGFTLAAASSRTSFETPAESCMEYA